MPIKHLSGPTSINYYSNNDKKIIIMTDIHNTKDGQCKVSDDTLDILRYLVKIVAYCFKVPKCS